MGSPGSPDRDAHGSAPAGARPRGGVRHEAMLHAGDGEFLSGSIAFIEDGLNSEEHVLVAVSARRAAMLRETLSDGREGVAFLDMAAVGGNPARIIPAYHEYLTERDGDRAARVLGEAVWEGRSAVEISECQRHESLLNVAFAGSQGLHLLCPYDVQALEPDVIEAVASNHPLIARGGHRERSQAYTPGTAPEPFAGELPPPAPGAERLSFAREDLPAVRGLLALRAAQAELEQVRAEDLVLAVDELATNSVVHGGGSGTLSVWRDDRALLCEVQDRGHIIEPLAGHPRRPSPQQLSGRGLWLVNQLCDLVQIRSSAAGSTIRVHMRLG